MEGCGEGGGVRGLFLVLKETFIPNDSILLTLEPIEKVPVGWGVVLESHFSVQLKPEPS